MREKGRFLKNLINLKSFVIIFISILFFKSSFGIEPNLRIEKYFKNLNLFSSKFIQSDETSIDEGYIYIDNAKIRLDYFNPKRTLKISKDKGVYINHELKEEEFFSTKNNLVKIFYDIFLEENFFSSLPSKESSNQIVFEKNIIIDSTNTNLKIFFEIKPLLLRKIITKTKNNYISISFYDHNFNAVFETDFFSFVPIYLD